MTTHNIIIEQAPDGRIVRRTMSRAECDDSDIRINEFLTAPNAERIAEAAAAMSTADWQRSHTAATPTGLTAEQSRSFRLSYTALTNACRAGIRTWSEFERAAQALIGAARGPKFPVYDEILRDIQVLAFSSGDSSIDADCVTLRMALCVSPLAFTGAFEALARLRAVRYLDDSCVQAALEAIAKIVGPDSATLDLAEYNDIYPGTRDTGKIDKLGRPIVVDRYGRRLWRASDYDPPAGFTGTLNDWCWMRQIHGPVTCG